MNEKRGNEKSKKSKMVEFWSWRTRKSEKRKKIED